MYFPSRCNVPPSLIIQWKSNPRFSNRQNFVLFPCILNKIAGKNPVWGGGSTHLTQQTRPRQTTRRKDRASRASPGPADPLVRPSPRWGHLSPAFSWTSVCILTSVSPIVQWKSCTKPLWIKIKKDNALHALHDGVLHTFYSFLSSHSCEPLHNRDPMII